MFIQKPLGVLRLGHDGTDGRFRSLEFQMLLLVEICLQVFVPLNEALGIHLAMSNLLAAIPLDPFQQGLKCLLLLRPQAPLLPFGAVADQRGTPGLLPLFQLISFLFHLPSLFVFPKLRQGFLLPPQLKQLAGTLHPRWLVANHFLELAQLLSVLFLQSLQAHVGSGFVVCHILIPGIGESQELRSLGLFHLHHLLLLGLIN
mmetsp:Transcript_34057/g.73693  ORF Transcript_34057/g.73693 Transcript_34057/m.73693 type:complete len:202 (-) Transcript_34057:497-1102(-)